MAEHHDEREGWQVSFRVGAIGVVAIPVALGIGVLITGVIYAHTLRPQLHYTVAPQPAPGLEAAVHAGVRDPEETPPVVVPDDAISRAKAEIVATGLPGWPKGER